MDAYTLHNTQILEARLDFDGMKDNVAKVTMLDARESCVREFKIEHL